MTDLALFVANAHLRGRNEAGLPKYISPLTVGQKWLIYLHALLAPVDNSSEIAEAMGASAAKEGVAPKQMLSERENMISPELHVAYDCYFGYPEPAWQEYIEGLARKRFWTGALGRIAFGYNETRRNTSFPRNDSWKGIEGFTYDSLDEQINKVTQKIETLLENFMFDFETRLRLHLIHLQVVGGDGRSPLPLPAVPTTLWQAAENCARPIREEDAIAIRELFFYLGMTYTHSFLAGEALKFYEEYLNGKGKEVLSKSVLADRGFNQIGFMMLNSYLEEFNKQVTKVVTTGAKTTTLFTQLLNGGERFSRVFNKGNGRAGDPSENDGILYPYLDYLGIGITENPIHTHLQKYDSILFPTEGLPSKSPKPVIDDISAVVGDFSITARKLAGVWNTYGKELLVFNHKDFLQADLASVFTEDRLKNFLNMFFIITVNDEWCITGAAEISDPSKTTTQFFVTHTAKTKKVIRGSSLLLGDVSQKLQIITAKAKEVLNLPLSTQHIAEQETELAPEVAALWALHMRLRGVQAGFLLRGISNALYFSNLYDYLSTTYTELIYDLCTGK